MAMLLSQPVLLTCPPPPLALRLLPVEKLGIQTSYQLSLLSPQGQTLRAKQRFTDDCEERPTWRDSKLWEEFPVYFSIFQSAEHVTINSTGINIRGHQILSQAPENKLRTAQKCLPSWSLHSRRKYMQIISMTDAGVLEQRALQRGAASLNRERGLLAAEGESSRQAQRSWSTALPRECQRTAKVPT